MLLGSGDLLKFDANGQIVSRAGMSTSAQVAQVPPGVWHGFWVAEPGTAIMEVKPGPYRPSDFAEWAPPEGDGRVAAFLHQLAPRP